tara:strand:+ start:261 stop:509 length:249 start_codon:yes stop_codon:yes gene_type:complete
VVKQEEDEVVVDQQDKEIEGEKQEHHIFLANHKHLLFIVVVSQQENTKHVIHNIQKPPSLQDNYIYLFVRQIFCWIKDKVSH